MRRDALRLLDIVRAAVVVEDYLDGISQERFVAGGLHQDAVLRQLMVIGEAAYKITTELQNRTPYIPWLQIIGFRHRLVHDYFGLDIETVWKIASSQLPLLHLQITALLVSEFPEDGSE